MLNLVNQSSSNASFPAVRVDAKVHEADIGSWQIKEDIADQNRILKRTDDPPLDDRFSNRSHWIQAQVSLELVAEGHDRIQV